jgi:aspartyl-tRNA(Asn)/glutamyl-tRNA(Gln) amidotransferase subunit C
MALSLDDVKRLAQLARIEISDDAAQALLGDLVNIFKLIEQMQAVPAEGVEAMPHAQDVVLRLRDDMVAERDQHVRFQAIAPQVEAGLYLVPKVIE